ncbi:MAG: YraN family protein [Chloroflexi bacterium]|nr:YraN family protein [Chloroflexota bacterium]
MTDRRRTAFLGETIAAEFARTQNWEIIDRNVGVPPGETDLVVRDGAMLVILEVRTRRSASHGTAAESLTAAKRRRMGSCAFEYVERIGMHPDQGSWRNDLTAVTLLPGASRNVEHYPHVLSE